MSKDDSSIDNIINDGDFIIIIEDRNYPDDSYYHFLQKKNEEKITIGIDRINFEKIYLNLPINVKICEMLNAYKLMNGIDDRNFDFLYNAKKIDPKNETKINEVFQELSLLTCYEKYQIMSGFIIKGKKIKKK